MSTDVAARVIACQRSTYERPRSIRKPAAKPDRMSGSHRWKVWGSDSAVSDTTISTPSPNSRPDRNERARSACSTTSRTEAGPSKTGAPPSARTTVVGRSGRASNTHRLVAEGKTGSRMPANRRDRAGAAW